MNRAAAAKWLKQALHDLDMAGKNVGIGGYDTAAFLAHQSVEKLLAGSCGLRVTSYELRVGNDGLLNGGEV